MQHRTPRPEQAEGEGEGLRTANIRRLCKNPSPLSSPLCKGRGEKCNAVVNDLAVKPFLLALSLFLWAHCRRHERIHYSHQGYDSESGAPWAARFRHDHSVAEPPQRGVLRTQ